MSEEVRPSRHPIDETLPQSDVRTVLHGDDSLIHLHTAEYTALTTRATYFITLATGIFPLMGIYLALVAQFCKPEGIPLRVAYQYLLRLPIQRSAMFWGNLFILGIMLRLWSQFLVEQYKIVLYIERDLRAMVQDSVASSLLLFWGYEAALRKGRGGTLSTWWEYSVSCGVGITILIVCATLWPLTRWDALGLAVDLGLWVSLIFSAREAQTTRRAWEKSLLDNAARSTLLQKPTS